MADFHLRASEMRLRPRLLISLLALGAIVFTILIATTVAQAADVDSETIKLEPGDNFIGWVAEPIAVADIFADLPSASLIYSWSADSRTYRYAIREVDGNLETLDSGMAAMIRISGSEPVEWERPLTPAKGMVTLYSGVNWVAWNGRDEWPLDEVARGIGTSLVSIEVRGLAYQSNSNIADAISPLSGDTKIRRGDALRVTVNRDLRWLQPTGMMPNIEFVGDISQSLKDNMTADIGDLVDYFADTHAVETDFSNTTILIWDTAEDAVAYQDNNPQYPFHLSGEGLRVYLEKDAEGGGTSWGMHLKSSWWNSNPKRSIFKTHVTHEWFHYLQIQFTDFWQSAGKPPEWMLEGTAIWSGDFGIRIAEGHISFQDTRQAFRERAEGTAATLRSAEQRNTPWQYQLGLLAVDLLIERSGPDAIVEYFRQQHPQAIGTDRQWQVAPGLSEAFSAAFGIEIDDFYTQFGEWRDALPGRRVRETGEPKLIGSFQDSEGTPAIGFWVNAAPYEGEHKAGRLRRAEVGADGTFSLDLRERTVQRLYFDREGCTLWLAHNGLTTMRPQPGQYRDLDTRNLPDLNLTLPEGACENDLRVRVQTRYGEDRRVEVGIRGNDSFTWATSRRGESFVAYPPEPSEYHVLIRYGYCDLWYAPDRLVATRNEAQLIDLTSEAIWIEMRIPPDLCLHSIGGQLVIDDGAPVPRIWVTANSTTGSCGSYPDADGKFKITVPDAGSYSLSFGVDGCRVHWARSGATIDWHRATPITVADEDVTGIEFVVPDDPASLCD